MTGWPVFIAPEGTVNLEKVFTIAPRLAGNDEIFSFALLRINDLAGLYASAERA